MQTRSGGLGYWPGAEEANAWGTIAAWAWGVSRVVDYLVTRDDVDLHTEVFGAAVAALTR